LGIVEGWGEVVGIDGAHWDREIDATRPFEWKEKFAPTVTVDRDLAERVQKRWGHLLGRE
jgi:hypothetical protein